MTSTISDATTTTTQPATVRAPHNRLEMAWIAATAADGQLILVARWYVSDHQSRAFPGAA